MADHACDKGPMLDLLEKGQAKIFDKLDNLTETLQAVAVQKNDLDHMKGELSEIKLSNVERDRRIGKVEKRCQLNHLEDSKSLLRKAGEASFIAAAVIATGFVISLTAYIGFKNVQDYFDFQRTQINGEPVKH